MAGTKLIKEYLLKQNNQTKQKHTYKKKKSSREFTSQILNKQAEHININLKSRWTLLLFKAINPLKKEN